MGLFDRLRGDEGPRVAFVGIDGVPYSLIANNPEVFPNLTDIEEAGAGGAINSIVPPESSACWPALTTGRNPGETGVYGFQDREVGSYDTYVPMGSDVQCDRIWDIVGEEDRAATVLNVPVTFPPQPEIQRMVSGFLSPGLDRGSNPPAVTEYLESIDYKIDVNAKLGHDEDKEDFIENAHETVDARMAAFEEYLGADDWDLFFGVFMTTDRVNHFLFEDYVEEGEYYDAFIEFYAKVDAYIGQIREQLPEDVTLIVASDHGFSKLDYEVNLNAWLEKEGYLSFEPDHEELGDITDDTRAYSLIPGRMYLNLEGREPGGSVPEDEYETVREELRADLEGLEGPDGRPVCDRIVAQEDAYHGDHDAIAPDLTIIPNEGFDLKAGFNGDKDVFTTGPRNGMHNFEDACLFIDDEAATVGDVDLLDIAPTILDLMEVDYEGGLLEGSPVI